MNTLFTVARQRLVQVSLGVGAMAALALAHVVYAGPDASPSARAAARLKRNPPHNWLRHYLPDDRYKLAGGIWTVVSSEADQEYHRPDCPLMLRQSPDGVIGFASASDAREAGYSWCRICRPALPQSSRPAPTRSVPRDSLPEATALDGNAPLTAEERQQVAIYNRQQAQYQVAMAEWSRRHRQMETEHLLVSAAIDRSARRNGGRISPSDFQRLQRLNERLAASPPRAPEVPEVVLRRGPHVDAGAALRRYPATRISR